MPPVATATANFINDEYLDMATVPKVGSSEHYALPEYHSCALGARLAVFLHELLFPA
jgi:hypothetical protein